MTVSIRRMSLGAGFRYLMSTVARGDVDAPARSAMTGYYAGDGTPPGRFYGRGLAGLADGAGVPVASVVSPEALERMLRHLADPVTGEPLGRRPLERGVTIGADGVARPRPLPVAGFDLTFSAPKSVSVAWALADPATRQAIYAAHQQAVAFVLAYAEDTVLATRTGAGGVVREPVRGAVAAGFDHWDSRAGDPQLHTHLVVLNRAQTVSDGVWRTLDSRALFAATVTLSELYTGVLADHLTAALGWGWTPEQRAHTVEPKWEIAGVPQNLRSEFSRRTAAIDTATQNLIDQARATLGREPTSHEIIGLRQRATLETRPAKTKRSLADLADEWGGRAGPYLGGREPAAWVRALPRTGTNTIPGGDPIDPAAADSTARVVLEKVAEHRSTFTVQNVLAETFRTLQGVRFDNPADRVTAAHEAARHTLALAVRLTDDDSPRYTTRELLQAEERLLDAASEERRGPRVTLPEAEAVTAQPLLGSGVTLTDEQAHVVMQVACGGRAVELLIGPAGTGKSTTMAGLRDVWESRYGAGSVIGLAPSAAAAEVLGDAVGIPTENTAKWLYESAHQADRLEQLTRLEETYQRARASGADSTALRQMQDRGTAIYEEYQRWQLRRNQIVIVDEASLAGTLDLDRLIAASSTAGAKIVLVGDPNQLSPVPAGGAFRLLIAARAEETPDDPAPTLRTAHRFTDPWEAPASHLLRDGHPAAADAYIEHDRVTAAPREDVLDLLHAAWVTDTRAGLSSLMVAADQATVTDLNTRTQQARVRSGEVTHPDREPRILDDGTHVGVGDQIITRHNQRTLTTSGGAWVKNGDRWTVSAIHPDGSLTAQAVRGPSGQAPSVILPAAYVDRDVQLGYAVTAHRAQGATVDTTHAYVSTSTTREALYVMATRGRHTNHLYVDIDDHLAVTDKVDDEPGVRGREILRHATHTTAAEQSATLTARRAATTSERSYQAEHYGVPARIPRPSTPSHGPSFGR